MGRRVSKILGRFAGSARCILGQYCPASAKGGALVPMCPACLANAVLVAVGSASNGGLNVLVRQISRKKTQKAKSEETKMRLQEIEPERETNHLNLQLTQVPVTNTGMLI